MAVLQCRLITIKLHIVTRTPLIEPVCSWNAIKVSLGRILTFFLRLTSFRSVVPPSPAQPSQPSPAQPSPGSRAHLQLTTRSRLDTDLETAAPLLDLT